MNLLDMLFEVTDEMKIESEKIWKQYGSYAFDSYGVEPVNYKIVEDRFKTTNNKYNFGIVITRRNGTEIFAYRAIVVVVVDKYEYYPISYFKI